MFAEDMPKIVAGYFDLFDAVEQHFKNAYAMERMSRQGELSLEFKNAAGLSLLYLGMRWDLWDRMHLPLWLGVRPDWGQPAVDCFGARNPGRCFFYDGYSLCPVAEPIAASAGGAPELIALLERELAAAQLAAGE